MVEGKNKLLKQQNKQNISSMSYFQYPGFNHDFSPLNHIRGEERVIASLCSNILYKITKGHILQESSHSSLSLLLLPA